MTLTPEAVRNKQFSTNKFREGYDMGEVDHFLDQVEQELERLASENQTLQGRIKVLQSAAPAAGPEADGRGGASATPAAERQSVPEASKAAARILEKAALTADELVAEATEQAEQLTQAARAQADELTGNAKASAAQLEADARANAERVTNEAHGKASRLDAESRSAAEKLDREVADRRIEMFGKLETERERLARDVEELRAFERDYRAQLRSFFSEHLDGLDAKPSLADDVSVAERVRDEGPEAGVPRLRVAEGPQD